MSGARLTDAEREALADWQAPGNRLECTVERILAERLERAPVVEITEHLGQPTTCKVWRNGALAFVGWGVRTSVKP